MKLPKVTEKGGGRERREEGEGGRDEGGRDEGGGRKGEEERAREGKTVK